MASQELDDFIEVLVHEEHKESKQGAKFKKEWFEQASAKVSSPTLFGIEALRKLYPRYSLVLSDDYKLNLLNFPAALVQPLAASQVVKNVTFVPNAQRSENGPGYLNNNVEYGAFKLGWSKYEFLLFIMTWTQGFSPKIQRFILYDGPEQPIRDLLLAAGSFQDRLHEEIWVYNQNFWAKDHALWLEVQKADWKDVILKDEFKRALQKDIYGFFKSESVYKELAIPWKRGLIFYGPPGNGKTISIKAILKTCHEEGYSPLYVKSFQGWKGEEAAMAEVFGKARQMAPCVLILEDLDSLINDRNRSFFLNQLDGLEANDGLLVIGSTNHFERLDPGLSTRPSRFDRKYLFDDPSREERILYAQYWQKKLEGNNDVQFPDILVDEVANMTEGFSFAYLKEAFVSTLVTLAGMEKDRPNFSTALKLQIQALRKQLEKTHNAIFTPSTTHRRLSRGLPPLPNDDNNGRDVRVLLDALSDSIAKSPRLFESPSSNLQGPRIRSLQSDIHGNRDVRALLDALSDAIDKNRFSPSRIFDTRNQSYPQQFDNSRDFRALLDGLSNRNLDADGFSERLSSHRVFNTISPVEQDWMGHQAHDHLHKPNPFFPGSSDTVEQRSTNEGQFERFNPFSLGSSSSETNSKWPSSADHQAL